MADRPGPSQVSSVQDFRDVVRSEGGYIPCNLNRLTKRVTEKVPFKLESAFWRALRKKMASLAPLREGAVRSLRQALNSPSKEFFRPLGRANASPAVHESQNR
jgi:hypothetical protein